MQFDITPYRWLEWQAAAFCCWDYVRLVLRDYLGAELDAVGVDVGGPLEAARQLKTNAQRKAFVRLDKPEPFCVVELQQFRSPEHVGVYVIVDGKPYITHCERGSGVLLSTLGEIQERYKITGFYRYAG